MEKVIYYYLFIQQKPKYMFLVQTRVFIPKKIKTHCHLLTNLCARAQLATLGPRVPPDYIGFCLNGSGPAPPSGGSSNKIKTNKMALTGTLDNLFCISCFQLFVFFPA